MGAYIKRVYACWSMGAILSEHYHFTVSLHSSSTDLFVSVLCKATVD